MAIYIHHMGAMMTEPTKPQGLGAFAQAVILRAAIVDTRNAELDAAKKQLALAEEVLKAALLQAGLKSVKYRDWTVFLRTIIAASLKGDDANADNPKQAAIDALKSHGLGWLVKETVNKNTLSAWARELPKDEATLAPKVPDAVKQFIEIFQNQAIGIRSS